VGRAQADVAAEEAEGALHRTGVGIDRVVHLRLPIQKQTGAAGKAGYESRTLVSDRYAVLPFRRGRDAQAGDVDRAWSVRRGPAPGLRGGEVQVRRGGGVGVVATHAGEIAV